MGGMPTSVGFGMRPKKTTIPAPNIAVEFRINAYFNYKFDFN
jgi:hypothetical protein